MANEPKNATNKIIDYFRSLQVNEPVAIKEIVNATGLSWTGIKKILQNGNLNIHFRKSANTWIAWKDTERVGPKQKDSCARFLRETPQNKV